jgi:hypothetical protein
MTELILTLKNRCKTIPYISQTREDGTVNHGFRILKGRQEDVPSILEVQDSEALRYALSKINETNTAFFTVGCEKDLNHAPEGYWARGYLEFSINSVPEAADADHYFRIFSRFNRHVWESSFDAPVQYHFELEEADFRESGTRGFTAAVWVTTLCFPVAPEALTTWNEAVVFLADFLSSFKQGAEPGIYKAF